MRAPSQNLDVLIVEDDDDHAELILDALRAHELPLNLHRVNRVSKALDFLDRGTPPRVVLVDLKLPDGSGQDVLCRVKTSPLLASVPVVVLTTSDADVDRARAYASGANSYLLKGLEFDELQSMISLAGSYWIRWNRPAPS